MGFFAKLIVVLALIIVITAVVAPEKIVATRDYLFDKFNIKPASFGSPAHTLNQTAQVSVNGTG